MRGSGKAFGCDFLDAEQNGTVAHPADRLRKLSLVAREDRDAIRTSTCRSALSSIVDAEVPDESLAVVPRRHRRIISLQEPRKVLEQTRYRDDG
jgi:hypothetical protein